MSPILTGFRAEIFALFLNSALLQYYICIKYYTHLLYRIHYNLMLIHALYYGFNNTRDASVRKVFSIDSYTINWRENYRIIIIKKKKKSKHFMRIHRYIDMSRDCSEVCSCRRIERVYAFFAFNSIDLIAY